MNQCFWRTPDDDNVRNLPVIDVKRGIGRYGPRQEKKRYVVVWKKQHDCSSLSAHVPPKETRAFSFLTNEDKILSCLKMHVLYTTSCLRDPAEDPENMLIVMQVEWFSRSRSVAGGVRCRCPRAAYILYYLELMIKIEF